jgi:hypothetical protein
MVSTIGEQPLHNPRLQVESRQACIGQMNALDLEAPRLMDIAVSLNRVCGLKSAG